MSHEVDVGAKETAREGPSKTHDRQQLQHELKKGHRKTCGNGEGQSAPDACAIALSRLLVAQVGIVRSPPLIPCGRRAQPDIAEQLAIHAAVAGYAGQPGQSVIGRRVVGPVPERAQDKLRNGIENGADSVHGSRRHGKRCVRRLRVAPMRAAKSTWPHYAAHAAVTAAAGVAQEDGRVVACVPGAPKAVCTQRHARRQSTGAAPVRNRAAGPKVAAHIRRRAKELLQALAQFALVRAAGQAPIRARCSRIHQHDAPLAHILPVQQNRSGRRVVTPASATPITAIHLDVAVGASAFPLNRGRAGWCAQRQLASRTAARWRTEQLCNAAWRDDRALLRGDAQQGSHVVRAVLRRRPHQQLDKLALAALRVARARVSAGPCAGPQRVCVRLQPRAVQQDAVRRRARP